MYSVELYVRVRHACHVEGMSIREAARAFGVHRDTVRKMVRFSIPPGYPRSHPRARPKLDPFTGVIDHILEGNRECVRRQRHTAKQIFERLRDKHGFTGGYTIVKDYVRERRLRFISNICPPHPTGRPVSDPSASSHGLILSSSKSVTRSGEASSTTPTRTVNTCHNRPSSFGVWTIFPKWTYSRAAL